MHVIYCHGFASSPLSKKATGFRAPLEKLGVHYYIPDLNAPSFETLTLTAMLATLDSTIQALDEQAVVLIGSSMGGMASLHFYDRYRHTSAQKVTHMILLAPAFDFANNRERDLGEGWRGRWQAQGWQEFYNFSTQNHRAVHYGLVQDLDQYVSWELAIEIPILIYHGRQDATVPYQQSERFAQTRPNVTLHVLESDHQLLDQTDTLIEGITQFLGL